MRQSKSIEENMAMKKKGTARVAMRVISVWGPLSLKLDRSTLPFLKIDRRHRTILISTGKPKKTATVDIALFLIQQATLD